MTKNSPLTQSIHHAFEHMKQSDHSAMFIFWDNWGADISIIGVKKGTYPWDAYDQAKTAQPESCYTLLMALDLKEPFEKQFPDHLSETLETLECFSMTPLIWIPDRTGRVPERERQKVFAEAAKPTLQLVGGNKDLEAKAPPTTGQKKPRPSYLRPV